MGHNLTNYTGSLDPQELLLIDASVDCLATKNQRCAGILTNKEAINLAHHPKVPYYLEKKGAGK